MPALFGNLIIQKALKRGQWLGIWHSRHLRQISRLISVLICLTFVLPYLTFAFEAQPQTAPALQPVMVAGRAVEIPVEMGTVVKSHVGTSGRVVVYIQDLHCNAEVQNHIAGMLGQLVDKYGLQLVGVEGASRPVDVSRLRDFPVEAVKKQVGQYFLKAGKITGAEYYASTGKRGLEVFGLEDAAQYEAERVSVKSFLTDESQGYVYDLRESLESLKKQVYSENLRQHDHHRVGFREGKESLLHYALYLANALKSGPEGLSAYPQLSAYVSQGRDMFGSSVEADALYQELERADEACREGLYTTSAERTLVELEKRLDIIEKLVNISAAPEELAAYRANPGNYRVKNFTEFISAQDASGELAPEAELGRLDAFVKETENFYRLADTRSQTFVAGMEKRLAGAPGGMGAMITGGFHTEEVLRELERRGIGYVSVKPKITQADLVNPYFSLLQDKRTPLEKMLAQNQNILSLAEAFPEKGLPIPERRKRF